MAEPTLSEVHADLVGRLKQDERLREVEKQVASLSNLPDLMQRMEARLVTAISDNKPKSPWPAVGSLAAVMSVLLVLAAAIYAK
ncbi:MAG TPA: hypothetical protein VIQ11_15490 [Mycobacterium sp.]